MLSYFSNVLGIGYVNIILLSNNLSIPFYKGTYKYQVKQGRCKIMAIDMSKCEKYQRYNVRAIAAY